MQYYENLGLESLFDTDEAFEGMIRYVCHEGKETMGFWGLSKTKKTGQFFIEASLKSIALIVEMSCNQVQCSAFPAAAL